MNPLWRRLSLSRSSLACLGVALFAVVYRLLTLPMIRSGGDAVRKWSWARVVNHGWSPSHALSTHWDHHAARLSINVPAAGVQWLFGDHPALYYVAPIASHATGAVLLFLIGRRVSGSPLGLVSSIAFVVLISSRQAAQLMPASFSTTYMLAAVYCALMVRESRRPFGELGWALLMAASVMLAELSKVPNLFFVPGLVVGLWLSTRRWPPVVAFCMGLLLLLAVEFFAYRLLQDRPWGRASVIASRHLSVASLRAPIDGFWELFARQRPALSTMHGLAAAFLPVTAVGLWKIRSLPPALRVILPACASFLFFHVFALRSLDPLLPLQPARGRYVRVLEPFVYLTLAWVMLRYVRFELPAWLRARPAAATMATCGALCLYAVAVHTPGFDEYPMVQLHRYRQVARKAYAEGLPVLSHDRKRYGMHAYLGLFWDDFGAAKWQRQRRIPPFLSGNYRGKRLWYVTNPAHETVGRRGFRRALKRWRGKPALMVHHDARGMSVRVQKLK